MYGEEGRITVQFIAEQLSDAKTLVTLPKVLDGLGYFLGLSRVVLFLRKLQESLGVFKLTDNLLPGFNAIAQAFSLGEDLLRLVPIVPERGIGSFRVQLCYALVNCVGVKDASRFL